MQTARRFPTTLEIAHSHAGVSVTSRVIVGVLLLAIMLLGGYFRFVGLNWDDFTHLHPDERFLTGVASAIGGGLSLTDDPPEIRQQRYEECLAAYPDTSGVGGFFDARCSNLNPHNVGNGLYVYGTLPLFLTRGAAEGVVALSEMWARLNGDDEYTGYVWREYYGVHMVWRALSALSEMGAIVLVFLIGAKLFDQWIGVLAALLYAAAVFSIQLAHFGTADAMANFFCTLALYYAVQTQRDGGLLNYGIFGLALGATLASRINLAPLAGVIVLAAILRAMPGLHKNVAWGERERLISEGLIGVALAGFVTLLAFRIFNPYTFNGPGFFGLSLNPRWLEDLNESRQFVTGTIDFPPNYQWASRTLWIYPLKDMILWGMGLVFGLVAWVSVVWAGVRIVRGKPGALLNAIPFVWVLVYFGYMGGQWVMVIRYYIPLYPMLAVLAAWGLFSVIRFARARERRLLAAAGRVLLVLTAGFTVVWALMFTNIYRHQLTRVQASYWVIENVHGDFAMQFDGAPEDAPLIQIAIPNCSDNEDLLFKATCFNSIYPGWTTRFTAPDSGTVSQIFAPHLADPLDDPDPETLRIRFYRDDQPDAVISETTIEQDFPRETHILGGAYTFTLDQPLELERGVQYRAVIELVAGDALLSGGTVFSWEGAWDDPIPVKVCELPIGTTLSDAPPPGLVGDPLDCNGLDPSYALVVAHELNIVYDDTEDKRQNLIRYLNESDFIAISSNRFYDSMSRNPGRYPMTLAYYDALFSGELGFELVAQFDETFELGGLRISDQHLPTYDSPDWLNELESDEAFSVYDHPAVFIFQKRADYDPQAVARFFYDISLTRVGDSPLTYACPGVATFYCDPSLEAVNPLSTSQAHEAPTQLRFTDEMWNIQTIGGTWSERFDPESTINTEIPVTIAVWWLAIMVFGWVTFPLLFVAFPGLADRGYAMSKFAGMFFVGWATWFLASVRINAWNQVGIIIAMIALFALGVILLRRTRAPLGEFLKTHWRRLLIIDLLTFALFAAFLLIRMSNPDLWHTSFGGEKPMDFAYFNGVLRSTIFPPIDPWNSGGFINYYYFGFVIVGTPVLLLKMVPSIAYNLILPTLFAATGIGAFAVAFSAMNAWRERRIAREEAETEADNDDSSTAKRPITMGSVWIAGIAALVMVVILGNLDSPRVFLTGVARMGGFNTDRNLELFLTNEFVTQNQREPNEEELRDLLERSLNPNIVDRVRYEIDTTADVIASIGRGFGELLSGERLQVSAERWFWQPSRVYAETRGVEGGAITEMPYFTFIYGDLHAHMISMPLQLFAMAFILHEVITAGIEKRRMRLLAIMLGAIAVGMLRATNTWDWITYMVFGVVGLGYTWVMRTRAFKWTLLSRRALIDALVAVGGFVAITFAAAVPYLTWFVSNYNSVLPWEKGKAPIWGYLTIHGLFLFVIVSLLAWDTARWLRSVQVKSLRGTYNVLAIGIVIITTVLIGAFVLFLLGTPVTIIVVPLIVWIAVLFFRKGQTLSMHFLLAAAGLALALTLAVEYVVLAGDIERQNTVFKFYLQAWLMFGVVSGVGVAVLIRQLRAWSAPLRNGWSTAFIILAATAAMFPIMATLGKSIYRFDTSQPLTLDGIVYMQYASYHEYPAERFAADPSFAHFSLDGDYQMIRWLQENIQGTPIIIEGQSDREYLWGGRVSINTGLPAVIGWRWHQSQQHTLETMGRQVDMRLANVNAFYQTTEIETALRILRFYDVSYIIVGDLERAYYTPEGLAKFGTMVEQGYLELIYEQGNSRVYHVIAPSAVTMGLTD